MASSARDEKSFNGCCPVNSQLGLFGAKIDLENETAALPLRGEVSKSAFGNGSSIMTSVKSAQSASKTKRFLIGCLTAFVSVFVVAAAAVVGTVLMWVNSPDPDRFPERSLFGLDKPFVEYVTNAGFEISFTGPKSKIYFSEYLVPESHQIPFKEAVAKYDVLLKARGWTSYVDSPDDPFAGSWHKGTRTILLTDGSALNPGRVPDPVVLLRQVSVMDTSVSTADRAKQIFKRRR